MKSAKWKRPEANTALAPESTLKRNIARRLAARFALRMHVLLIVLWSLAWGVGCNKALHWVGLESPPWRYGTAAVAAWLAMLVAFKLWLAYTGFTQRRKQQRASESADSGADLDFDFDLPRIGGSTGRAAVRSSIGEHGGTFSGGGASADFEPFASADDGSPLGEAASSMAEGLSSADEFLPVALVIAVVVAVVAASLGVLTYFYTQGPMLLSEAAFEVLLAGGLIRTARRANDADWLRTVVVKTAVPWLIVLGCAIAVGLLLR
ncbi:hypothetical protein [Ralstonia sp. UBA689]|uniref:hypothetical protein n=1 Tax=Ralstonia sp. UBA689 TaxID=1947373 RepID=UPI0025E9616D|nr:hypothetical protein [Ralstonia sp. UBA689]